MNNRPTLYIESIYFSLVSLKLENRYTDLANFGIELFVEVQGKFETWVNVKNAWKQARTKYTGLVSILLNIMYKE